MAWWSAIPAGKALWKSGKWAVKKYKTVEKAYKDDIPKKHRGSYTKDVWAFTLYNAMITPAALKFHKHTTSKLKGKKAQEQTLYSRHNIPESKLSNYTKMRMKKIKKRMQKEGKL